MSIVSIEDQRNAVIDLILAELARLERRDTQDLRNAIVDALKSSAETRQRLGFTAPGREIDCPHCSEPDDGGVV